MAISFVSPLSNPYPHVEALPSGQGGKATEDATKQGNKERSIVHVLSDISFTVSCAYHALSAPFLFIPSVGLGALTASASCPRNKEKREKILKELQDPSCSAVLSSAMVGSVALNCFTPASYVACHAFSSLSAGWLAGNSLYCSLEEDSIFRRQVDAINDTLSSTLNFAISKIPHQIQKST